MMLSANTLLPLLSIDHPIIQAPMAGISTPAMAASVSNAGGLGSLGVGATDAAGAREMIAGVRERSMRSLNVNVFCHAPARADAAREAAWIERLRPEFERFGAQPPAALSEIYRSFVADDDMLAALVETRPKVVSFHFGVPSPDRVRALREAGIVLLGSATNLDEARRLVAGGVHAVVAQGDEAGGHRGVFDPGAPDDELGTLALTRLSSSGSSRCRSSRRAGSWTAPASPPPCGWARAQLNWAPRSSPAPSRKQTEGYRAAMKSEAALRLTVVTRAISGRPARCLANRFTAWGADVLPEDVPDYPIAYDLGKTLHAAAKAAAHESGFGAQWAGQGAPLARFAPGRRSSSQPWSPR